MRDPSTQLYVIDLDDRHITSGRDGIIVNKESEHHIFCTVARALPQERRRWAIWEQRKGNSFCYNRAISPLTEMTR